MIFGVILGGGLGSRMGNTDKPKQFLHIGKKPTLIHTLEKMIINERFDKVIVTCPDQWMAYTKDMVKKYLPDCDVDIILGGATRNGTILNSILHVEKNYGLDDETVVVTHDAVRPFVTQRILDENIDAAINGVACDTVIPAADTIVESINGEVISCIPNRAHYYQGQTPQSFKAKMFKDLYESMSEEDKAILTDACKVFVVNGKDVTIVKGETFNNKVTYAYDLRLAETLLGGNE